MYMPSTWEVNNGGYNFGKDVIAVPLKSKKVL